MRKTKLNVNQIEVVLFSNNEEDYISLTDMAKYRDSERTNYIIQNWMRTQSTIEFLGLWESLNNPDLKASNSMPLDWKQDLTVLHLLPKSGLIIHQQLVLSQKLADMEEPMRIRI
jgi:hypothetical protein